ncbi:MAG: hypothetical protein ACOZEN_00950 [Thermodesulfobacteriota bacterium]
MRATHAALIVLIALLASGQAARAQTRHSAPDGTFSISLPSDWVPIPTLELYFFENPGRKGPVPPEVLAEFRDTRMGFQMPAEKWFTLPYMIVTVEKGRKRTAKDLFMESVMAEKDSETSAPKEGYRFLEKEHLPTKRVTYYKDVSYSAAQGRNVAMGVYTYLTSQGFLRVAWFAAEDDPRATGNMLHQAAMSVTLSPQMEYRPEGRK